MDAWCELNCVAEASAFFEGLLQQGVLRPNEAVYNVMIKGFARCRCKRAHGVCGCNPCRCSQPEQASQKFREMAELGLHPDTVTLNTLLDAHCSAGQLPHACSLLESICRSNAAKLGPSELRAAAAARQPARRGRSAPSGAPGGPAHGGAGAGLCRPNLVSFETVLRGALRSILNPPGRPGGAPAAHGCGGGGGGGGGGGCCGAPPPPSTTSVLELLAPIVSLLRSCCPALDTRTLGTLGQLCTALRVGWRPPPAAAEPADADGAAATAEAQRALLEALSLAWERAVGEAEEEAAAAAHLLPSALFGAPPPHAPPPSLHPPHAPALAPPHAPPPHPPTHAPPLPLATSAAVVATAEEKATQGEGEEGAASLRVWRLRVVGLSCQGCVGAVEQALRGVAGVREAEVSLEEGAATVRAHASVAPHTLVTAVEAMGKGAQLLPEAVAAPADEAPLSGAERAELLALRARVQELEAALRGVRAAVGGVAL